MVDSFTFIKLNRCVWVSLLEQKKVLEAGEYFSNYINELTALKGKRKKAELEKEVLYALNFFINKLISIADEYFRAKDYSQAVLCYSAIFKHNQKNIEVIKNYITCLEHLKQADLEIELLLYLESFVSQQEVDLAKHLSIVYDRIGNNNKSVELLEKYKELKGENNLTADEFNLLGCFYHKLFMEYGKGFEIGQISLNYFKRAAMMNGEQPIFIKNTIILAGKLNEVECEKEYWTKKFNLPNVTNDDKFDYAAFCLRHAMFDEWYKYYDARFLKENNRTQFPQMDKPLWTGEEDLSSSTLLVHYEQGFGDTFLMFGYIPRLVKLAKKVIFVTQNGTDSVLKNSNLNVDIIPHSQAHLDNIEFDYYIPSMSIPVALKLKDNGLSVGAGYIKSNPYLVEEFKQKYFLTDKFKIGIAFSGNSTGDKTRDISVDELLPFDNLENVELYSLTKDIDEEVFSKFKKNKIKNVAKDFNNFDDTAAVMDNLDLVVTTDNCILNLAGALGKKTLGLFNYHYNFRWYDINEQDCGYFKSVKPFVNKVKDDWTSTVQDVINEVKSLIIKNS